jgi:hypothetical protein
VLVLLVLVLVLVLLVQVLVQMQCKLTCDRAVTFFFGVVDADSARRVRGFECAVVISTDHNRYSV